MAMLIKFHKEWLDNPWQDK